MASVSHKIDMFYLRETVHWIYKVFHHLEMVSAEELSQFHFHSFLLFQTFLESLMNIRTLYEDGCLMSEEIFR